MNLMRRIRDLWCKRRGRPAADALATPGSQRAALPIDSEASNPAEAWLLWSAQEVWPALRGLAKSNFSLWSPLDRVARTLPKKEREAWRAVVKEMILTRSKLLEDPLVLWDRVFARLVKVLNERWFLPRQILFACLPNPDAPPVVEDVWQAVRLVIYRTLVRHRFPFRDADVLLYEVSCVFPPGVHDQHRYYNDPASEWAVIDVDHLKFEALDLFSLSDDKFHESYLKMDPRPHVLRVRAWAGPEFRRVFASPFALFQALRHRTMCEEVRHGIDSKRVLRGRPLAALRPEYTAETAEALLAPGGRLRREVWELAASGPEDEGVARRHQAARIVQEVSAQLTAAAVGPAPQMLLVEWKERTAIACLEFLPDAGPARQKLETPSETAARIAVILLAERVGLTPSLGFGAASHSDYERLDSLAEALYLQSSEALRLALKEIYRREFIYNEIDETPFGRIEPNGELVNRPLPPPAPPQAPPSPKADDLPCPTSPNQS